MESGSCLEQGAMPNQLTSIMIGLWSKVKKEDRLSFLFLDQPVHSEQHHWLRICTRSLCLSVQREVGYCRRLHICRGSHGLRCVFSIWLLLNHASPTWRRVTTKAALILSVEKCRWPTAHPATRRSVSSCLSQRPSHRRQGLFIPLKRSEAASETGLIAQHRIHQKCLFHRGKRNTHART